MKILIFFDIIKFPISAVRPTVIDGLTQGTIRKGRINVKWSVTEEGKNLGDDFALVWSHPTDVNKFREVLCTMEESRIRAE